MKSPFPGMDPYLEQHWGDVHQAFVTYIRDLLQPQLPENLRARMQERVYIELPEGMRREYYPDVRVFEYPGTRSADAPSGEGSVAVADSVLIDLDLEPRTENYVQVIDVRSGHRVVTAVEVVSPTNKRAGEGKRLYLQKRQDMILGGANTVEIDLLRAGDWLLPISPGTNLAGPSDHLPGVDLEGAGSQLAWRFFACPSALVCRCCRSRSVPRMPRLPWTFRAILDQCYRNGGYDDIDYNVPPSPPLSDDDRELGRNLGS